NSAANEGSPSISGDGLSLYFESFAPGTVFKCLGPGIGASGNSDIWVATRREPDRPFRTVTHLGRPVNSPTPTVAARSRRTACRCTSPPTGTADRTDAGERWCAVLESM